MSIRKCREAQGITQVEFAKAMGVDQSAVSWWETRRALPSSDKLPKMAKLLDCTIDALLEEDDPDGNQQEVLPG